MAIVKIETLPTDEYKLMLNGNEWEKDWNYNSDTGDYDLYEYVEKDLPTGEIVDIGIQAKEGYKLIPPTTITGGEFFNDDTGDYDVENYELTGNENYVNVSIDVKSVDYNFLNHDGWLLNVETSTSDIEPEPEPEPEPGDDTGLGNLPELVAAYLGKPNSEKYLTRAAAHVMIVTEYVRGYTRGKGFSDGQPAADLQAVIVSAAAKLTYNPEQVEMFRSGDYSERPQQFKGWTLADLAVLNRYRKRWA